MLLRLPLKYRVFFWVSLAVALPMVVLVGSAVDRGQRIYAAEVDADMFASLDRTVAALDRRLFIEHDLIRALSEVPAVTGLLPQLHAEKHDSQNIDLSAARNEATRFFETFQGVRRSLGTVRILDHDGDTLIKVRNGEAIPPAFEDLGEVSLIENGSEIAEFRTEIAGLRTHDVGSLNSPPGFDAFDAALNTTLPLLYGNEIVGYLLIAPPLEPIDRSLDVSARPRGATLLVAELNPDIPDRHGMVLYADDPRIVFSSVGDRESLDMFEPQLLEERGLGMGRKFRDEFGGTWYFREYSPYPDRLVTWLFAYHLQGSGEGTPFWHASYVLWGIGLLSLAIGLLLAVFVARQVSRPVSQLAGQLSRYAEGAREVRLVPSGAPEMCEAHLAFNRMADALERLENERDQTQRAMLQNAKLTSIGQLAAGIAHELRNPLANIFSLTKLVQRHLPDGDTQLRSDVDNIRSEAERASHIIQGLLDFARQGPAHNVAFDLPAWLHESVSLVERMAERRHIALHVAEPPCLTLYGDHHLLQQALVNILINAVQATPDDGAIPVAAARHDHSIEISVQDQGPGIAPDIADQVFDPFFTTKAEGEGTGLGLSIAIGIVEQHDGRLVLENGPGGGAIARICLPLPADSQDHDAGGTA